ncbi:MAG TPA: hypothetical protein VMW56_28595 [Candidatus Margulisiibacteriota bacterium]|nr:hypothetical protein [Candidatus Margulisiibacteriota bacterium]
MSPSVGRGEAGVALIAVLLLMALLMALAGALTTSINMDSGLRGAFSRSTGGFYAAESGLNRAMGDYRNIFLSFNTPNASDFATKALTISDRTVSYNITDVTAYDGQHNPPSITIPPGQLFGGLNSIEYDYIAGSSAQANGDTQASVNAEFKVGNIPIFQFVAFYSKDLEIAPGADMTLVGRVHTNGDLYLSADGALLSIPDDPANGINTVQVSARGKIYRGRKRANACDSGKVSVATLVDANHDGRLDPYGLNCNLPDTTTPTDASGGTREIGAAELATWKGSMINNLDSIAVPQPDIAARGTGAFWSKADLRIVLNLTKTWTPTAPLVGPIQYAIEVQDASGNVDPTLTAHLHAFMADTAWNAANSSTPGTRPIFYTDVPLSGGACGCTDTTPGTAPACATFGTANCYNPAFSSDLRVYGLGTSIMTANAQDADYRRGGFYNWREGKWLYLLNVNVQDLLAWNQAEWAKPSNNALFDPTDRSDGGIVLFLSVQGGESGNQGNPNLPGTGSRYGARIFGSAQLPFPDMGADPTGITVATDQAMYVLGDFNSANPWQPAAIIGDSINVLSNAWFSYSANVPAGLNDAQSPTASPKAQSTTIKAAYLGGVDDTISGSGTDGYNGGLENYPRFHENWGSDVTFTYSGSFVSLGTPLHVSGKWKNQNYKAPKRAWSFETKFGNAANLPPLTPRFVYVQQVLFTEQFK